MIMFNSNTIETLDPSHYFDRRGITNSKFLRFYFLIVLILMFRNDTTPWSP